LQGNISGNVTLKGLLNKINNITVLGADTRLSYDIVGKVSWSKVPGLVYINIPKGVQDKYVTVLKVSLDDPIRLYSGKGGL
jgi:alpha-L-fucosidase